MRTHSLSLVLHGFALNLALSPLALAQGAAPLFSESMVHLSPDFRVQAVLDLDHDGDADLLSWWWVGEPNPLPLPQAHVAGLLVDGEGGLDLAWEFDTPMADNINCIYAANAVGDFDGDGFDDFAIGIWSHVFVYATRANAAPILLDTISVPGAGTTVEELRAADLDGDGTDDLVICNNYRVKALLSGGTSAPFTFVGELSIPGQATTFTHVLLTPLEYDQDGRDEIAVRRYDYTRVRFFGLENGAFVDEGWKNSPMPFVHSMAAGDIDGDGDDDLVTFDQQGLASLGTYQVFRRAGPTNYVLEPIATGGPATHLIDIDLDGDLDGLCCGGGPGCDWENDDESHFQIALNNGNGVFDNAIAIAGVVSGYDGLGGVVDLDGDGDFELIGGRSVLFNHLTVGAPYCEPPANSTGAVGRLSLSGSASVSRSDLGLHASALPAQKTSIIVLGGNAAEIPVGSSLLCLQAPFKRYAIVNSSSAGTIDHAIPIASLPAIYPGDVAPGETRRFQVWHRDSGLDGFGFSEAVRVTFTP